jgi:hypothetical protein
MMPRLTPSSDGIQNTFLNEMENYCQSYQLMCCQTCLRQAGEGVRQRYAASLLNSLGVLCFFFVNTRLK